MALVPARSSYYGEPTLTFEPDASQGDAVGGPVLTTPATVSAPPICYGPASADAPSASVAASKTADGVNRLRPGFNPYASDGIAELT